MSQCRVSLLQATGRCSARPTHRCVHIHATPQPVLLSRPPELTGADMYAVGANKLTQGNVFVWKLQQTYDQTQIMPVTHFSAHKEYITRILLSPDVKKLATCSADHTAKIWEVNNTKPRDEGERDPKPFPLEATLTGHQRWVWDCAFSADSAYLVTACSDHYARLWEVHSQQIIRQYNGHHRGAVCVALNDYSETR